VSEWAARLFCLSYASSDLRFYQSPASGLVMDSHVLLFPMDPSPEKRASATKVERVQLPDSSLSLTNLRPLARSYFSGDVESTDRRLSALQAVGSLEWDSLEELVIVTLASRDPGQLTALETFLDAVNEPTFRARVLEEKIRLLRA
jgi:hypothetical protein